MVGLAIGWLGATVSDEPYNSIFRMEKSLSGHITLRHHPDSFLHIDPRENQRRIFELKSQEMGPGGGGYPGTSFVVCLAFVTEMIKSRGMKCV